MALSIIRNSLQIYSTKVQLKASLNRDLKPLSHFRLMRIFLSVFVKSLPLVVLAASLVSESSSA